MEKADASVEFYENFFVGLNIVAIIILISTCFLRRHIARNLVRDWWNLICDWWNAITATVITCWGAITRGYGFITHNFMLAWEGITLLFQLLRTLVMWMGRPVLSKIRFIWNQDRATKISIFGATFVFMLGVEAIFVQNRHWKAFVVFFSSLSLVVEFVATYLVKMFDAKAGFEWFGVYFRERLRDGPREVRIRYLSAGDCIQLGLLSANICISFVHLLQTYGNSQAPSSAQAPSPAQAPSFLAVEFDITSSVACCFLTFLAALRQALVSDRFTRLKPDDTRKPMKRVKGRPYHVGEVLLTYPERVPHPDERVPHPDHFSV